MKIKITEEELKKIISEEVAAAKKRLAESDVASDEQVAEKAKALGYYLGGQPPTAAAVRDALAKTFPKAAEALYSAYQQAQAELDMVYSSYDE